MVAFSMLRNVNKNLSSLLFVNSPKLPNGLVSTRLMSSHRIFPLAASRFQYTKFKDIIHFYLMIGLIPVALFTTYINVFIGPAKLSEIPEGYRPEHWEYYSHPITRFIARYFLPKPQQEYEKFLHMLYEQDELAKLRLLEQKVKDLMQDRADYQAYYYIPYSNANYIRAAKDAGEEVKHLFGDL